MIRRHPDGTQDGDSALKNNANARCGLAGTAFVDRNTVCHSIIGRFIISCVPQLREEPDETLDCPVLFATRPGGVRSPATAAATAAAWPAGCPGRLSRLHRVFRLEPVVGRTGRSGGSAAARSGLHSRRLSARRAQHVAHILTTLAVAANPIQIAAAGESSLGVPTPDGVR